MNVNRVKPKPYWLKIREKERYKLELLVREKGDPSGRRLPIRMGIGVLLFNIPYYLIRPPMEYRYLFLCLRLASENVLSGPGEKESLGPDGNASFVSDRFSGADLGD